MPEERGWLGDYWAFSKYFYSGVWDAAAGTVEGVVELAKGGYALATDDKARESAWNTTKKLAKAAGDYGEEVLDDPAKASRDARDGTLAAYNTFEQAKEKAEAEGRSAEFWGNLTGKVGFEIGTIILGVGVAAKAGKLGKVAKGAKQLETAEDTGSLFKVKAIEDNPVLETADDVVKPVTKCPLKDCGTKNTQKRMRELAEEGHGPQRHEGEVTQKQLELRSTKGYDPMTGTTKDAITGQTHKYGKDSSKVKSPEAYVKAENHIRNSPEFKKEISRANGVGDTKTKPIDIPLKDIYGPGYKNEVSGATRIGSKKNPQGTSLTNFQDGTMRAIYKKDTNGNWKLLTMYPNSQNKLL